MTQKQRGGVSSPEGPYEAGPGTPSTSTTAASLDIVYFSDGFLASVIVELGLDPRDLAIVLHLVGNHFAGRLTTSSTLATSSRLSYGTALRSIDLLVQSGLIVKRVRTSTGKSYSLHPSGELLHRWQRFAGTVRKLADLSSSVHHASPKRIQSEAVISAPSVLSTKLTLSRGLRLLVHADPTFMAMNGLKKQFEMILGVPISSRALSIDRLRDEIIFNSERPNSTYDLVACDLPWFGEMVSGGRLQALDGLIEQTQTDLSDFYPDAVLSTRRRGRQYGIPLLSTAELLAFRKDLLGATGLAPPRTTAETLVAARALHQPAKGRFGIAWNAARGTALGHTFIVLMAAHGTPVVKLAPTVDGFACEDTDPSNLAPNFLSDAALTAAEYMRELLALSPPDIMSMTWYDRARAFASGLTGLGYSHTLLAHLVERDPSSPAHRQTGYVPHPVGFGGRPISPLGGYALSIPANLSPSRLDATWSALRSLTSPEASKLYITNGSLASSRFSVNKDPEVAAVSPLIGLVDELARSGVLRAWPRPPVPGISNLIRIAGEEMHDMLAGLRSPRQALAKAQQRAEAAI